MFTLRQRRIRSRIIVPFTILMGMTLLGAWLFSLLVKCALAPLFTARSLDVLSREGFNILGNRDGEIPHHPANSLLKVHSKEQILPKILGYSSHSKVGIGYVPPLGDRKTAWDFIHFRNFPGVDMVLRIVF